ncbi:Predicted metal-dependent hydrolase, TIM-barrel fold [Roseomonas rosea]|uniref:Predicted metal-dependent hydrolase, TIM-barrel fold n=1 Tax=Muricoccus roseus TaxID=198092 RepID=A0A1M6J0K4_9PROT|nr:amidohydrolase family protein [Roseomonas rosea]SHJ40254.1 Predicted metal-dependent hydrolase, TIM-barrel fold [Roseomonas rosea]
MNTPPPLGSTDCHVHAFGDPAAFPFVPERHYTPDLADAGHLRAFLDSHGLDNVVVVQPSTYGTDNRCTLDAVARLGDRARAVVVLDPSIGDAELAALHAAGARGVRLNLQTGGQEDLRATKTLVEAFAGRLRGSGWHLQVYAAHGVLAATGPMLARAGLPVVVDHFGLVGRRDTPFAEAAAAVEHLVAGLGLHIKLSAPQRSVPDPETAPELAGLVRRLLRAAPERLLWGSDWPHSPSGRAPGSERTVQPFDRIDDARALERIAEWIEDEAAVRRILVGNPAALYGFGLTSPTCGVR